MIFHDTSDSSGGTRYVPQVLTPPKAPTPETKLAKEECGRPLRASIGLWSRPGGVAAAEAVSCMKTLPRRCGRPASAYGTRPGDRPLSSEDRSEGRDGERD